MFLRKVTLAQHTRTAFILNNKILYAHGLKMSHCLIQIVVFPSDLFFTKLSSYFKYRRCFPYHSTSIIRILKNQKTKKTHHPTKTCQYSATCKTSNTFNQIPLHGLGDNFAIKLSFKILFTDVILPLFFFRNTFNRDLNRLCLSLLFALSHRNMKDDYSPRLIH